MSGRGVLPLPPCAGPIVDAVSHVVEPEAAWGALPDRYRPRTSTDRAGAERLVVGDAELLPKVYRIRIESGEKASDITSLGSSVQA